MRKQKGQGRFASIPVEAYPLVFRLRAEGHGCRMIARLLEEYRFYTTKSNAHRLLKGKPPYDGLSEIIEDLVGR